MEAQQSLEGPCWQVEKTGHLRYLQQAVRSTPTKPSVPQTIDVLEGLAQAQKEELTLQQRVHFHYCSAGSSAKSMIKGFPISVQILYKTPNVLISKKKRYSQGIRSYFSD